MKITVKKILLLVIATTQVALTHAQYFTDYQNLYEQAEEAPFKPYWQVGVQLGGAYDVGEDKFANLLSTAMQFSVSYRFSELLALRAGISGFWARNSYVFPKTKYQWNYVQPALDVKFHFMPLLGDWDDTTPDIYLLGGLGAACSYGNDEANQAQRSNPFVFYDKLWDKSRWNPAVRAGFGADFPIAQNINLNAEFNVNMLPDHFNSKRGTHDNRDWHMNLLVGVTIDLGKTRTHREEVPSITYVAPPVSPIENQDEDSIAMMVYIQFDLNKSIIRESEQSKLMRLANYLHDHPTAYVQLTGYADRETGTPTINQRLSEERAQAVSNYLTSHGIDSYYIRRYAKGDRVQPFDIPQDNRVTICIVRKKI